MDAIFVFGCPVNKTRLASFADSLPVKVMLLFLVLQAAFVLSNTAANCLPRPVIESHVQGSESSALLSDMYVYDHRVAAGPVCFDNNRFIIEVAQQKDQGSPFKTMTVAEMMTLRKPVGLRISSTTGIGMDGNYLRMSACLLVVSTLSWCLRPLWRLPAPLALALPYGSDFQSH